VLYFVFLDGRKIGPFDKRTIMGMRVRNTLRDEHMLLDSDEQSMSVREVLERTQAAPLFDAAASGIYSSVAAQFFAKAIKVGARHPYVPSFSSDVEVRVLQEVLRLSGRYRQFLQTKEDRVKLPWARLTSVYAKKDKVWVWLMDDSLNWDGKNAVIDVDDPPAFALQMSSAAEAISLRDAIAARMK
jgi:hypothetical protein